MRLLARVIAFDFGGDVFVANIDLVDDLELFDGFLLFTHAFEDAAEVIN